ncbi:hypothetical protein IF2G_00682 [Cordyceps javanica]|nr:hypothetical protein IF2G_00682 [Cordyceps javanica]
MPFLAANTRLFLASFISVCPPLRQQASYRCASATAFPGSYATVCERSSPRRSLRVAPLLKVQ